MRWTRPKTKRANARADKKGKDNAGKLVKAPSSKQQAHKLKKHQFNEVITDVPGNNTLFVTFNKHPSKINLAA